MLALIIEYLLTTKIIFTAKYYVHVILYVTCMLFYMLHELITIVEISISLIFTTIIYLWCLLSMNMHPWASALDGRLQYGLYLGWGDSHRKYPEGSTRCFHLPRYPGALHGIHTPTGTSGVLLNMTGRFGATQTGRPIYRALQGMFTHPRFKFVSLFLIRNIKTCQHANIVSAILTLHNTFKCHIMFFFGELLKICSINLFCMGTCPSTYIVPGLC